MSKILLIALALMGCSSTVSGGGDNGASGSAGSDINVAGSSGSYVGGASGSGEAGAAANGTGSAGANNAGSGGTTPLSCTAPLPTTFVLTPDGTSGWLTTCFYCVDSPCWTADLTWDESTLTFDEVYSTVSITVSVHSSGTILMKQTGCSGNICNLDVSDFSYRSTFKVVQVSNGYQITQVGDLAAWTEPSVIQAGTCGDYNLSSVGQQISAYWGRALSGTIIPCVKPSA
jgi:hypothetical protein